MSRERRRRAIAFAAAAALCAGLAAGAARGGRAGLPDELTELRDVVVARVPIDSGTRLRRRYIDRRLDVRRVPERFAPPGVLTAPHEALGTVTTSSIEPGGYLLAAHLEVPGEREPDRGRPLGDGRQPVEILVSAAATLAGRGSPSRLVDVIVTSEPGPGGGAGRTYVAAERVRLLGLRASGASAPADALPGPAPEAWVATLALRRADALRLIQAESFARSVRLIPR